MSRRLFIESLILCLFCLALLQIPDPGTIGITSEPSIILFYGGTGLVTGLSGVIAAGSGLYIAFNRFGGNKAPRNRSVPVVLMLTGLLIIILVLLIRLGVFGS
jgi:hypothetical protein